MFATSCRTEVIIHVTSYVCHHLEKQLSDVMLGINWHWALTVLPISPNTADTDTSISIGASALIFVTAHCLVCRTTEFFLHYL